MLFAPLFLFFLLIWPSFSLYSMDAPDTHNELQELIQAKAALELQIRALEEIKIQEEKILEQKRKEHSDAIAQSKKIRKQLSQLAESGMWAALAHTLDSAATKTYFLVLPPGENPSADRQMIDSSFLIAKSLVLQPSILKALYYNLNKPKKNTYSQSTQLIEQQSTGTSGNAAEIEHSNWYAPGICRNYRNIFFKRDLFEGVPSKDESLMIDIGARTIFFTASTVLLPIAVAYDSAKVIGNCYSYLKSSLGTSHD